MKSKYLEMFSSEERSLKCKLDALCNEWQKVVGEPQDLWFVPDGFYPNYLSQKVKILYLGRDSYDLYGSEDVRGEQTYIEKFIRQYISGVMDNGESVNRFKFHKMLIQVAYGLIHGCSWSDVPYASEICREGRIFEKTSFAFMNLCKWSHESGEYGAEWTADWKTIDKFVELSVANKRNFILEEIGLLEPDVIITMNFGVERIQRLFSVSSPVEECDDCYVYSLARPLGKCLVLDSWHFSSRNKSEDKNVYEPLRRMIKKHLK